MTAVLTTLVSFNGTNGYEPFNFDGLVAYSRGDVFGYTLDGTVFELVNNNGIYTFKLLRRCYSFDDV